MDVLGMMGKTLAVVLFEVKDLQEPEPQCLIYAFRPSKSADWETAMNLLSGKHVDGAIRKLVRIVRISRIFKC